MAEGEFLRVSRASAPAASYRDAVLLAHAGLDLGVDPQLVLTLPLRVEQHRLKLHPHFVGRGPRPVRLLRHDGDELFDPASETASCFRWSRSIAAHFKLNKRKKIYDDEAKNSRTQFFFLLPLLYESDVTAGVRVFRVGRNGHLHQFNMPPGCRGRIQLPHGMPYYREPVNNKHNRP